MEIKQFKCETVKKLEDEVQALKEKVSKMDLIMQSLQNQIYSMNVSAIGSFHKKEYITYGDNKTQPYNVKVTAS